jgi:hypothetical protein
MTATDDTDDLDLPAAVTDAASTGAAADSSDLDERLKALPRLLRYAMLANECESACKIGSDAFLVQLRLFRAN